jgi:hypothetical protein
MNNALAKDPKYLILSFAAGKSFFWGSKLTITNRPLILVSSSLFCVAKKNAWCIWMVDLRCICLLLSPLVDGPDWVDANDLGFGDLAIMASLGFTDRHI